MKKTIIYLVGKQGAGKTKLVQSIENSYKIQQPDAKVHLQNADAEIFLKAFALGNDYVIVTAQEYDFFTEMSLIGVCDIFELSFIKAEILI